MSPSSTASISVPPSSSSSSAMKGDTSLQPPSTIQGAGPFLLSTNPPHYLTAIQLTDTQEMVRIANLDTAVFDGTASWQYPLHLNQAETRIQRAITLRHQVGQTRAWAMRTFPDGPIIGWIHLNVFQENEQNHLLTPTTTAKKTHRQQGEIGYWVSKEYRGQGYTARSARFVTHELAFQLYGLGIVHGEAYVENWASRKVLEKAGMKVTQESFVLFMPKLNCERDLVAYAIENPDGQQD